MFFLNRFNLIVIPPLKILHFDIFLAVAEFRRGHPHLTTEVTAEGGLFVKTQHVGDGLYGEVASNMEQHLGFGHNL